VGAVRETTHGLRRTWGLATVTAGQQSRAMFGLGAVQIAAGYGVPGGQITTGEQLAAALRVAAAVGGPRLLEVPIETPPRQVSRSAPGCTSRWRT
jgi:thiamine pyrophosphate-dependent acetolactate synthase large subunit-like protein